MTFARWMLVVGVLATVLVAGIVIYMDNAPPPEKPERAATSEISREFLSILPDDMPEAQRKEIEDLLYIFFARADDGQVAVEDRIKVDNKLRGFVDQGSIERSELARFMAEVSFYAHRLDPRINPPDSSGMHPLLIEDTTDSQ